MLHPSYTDLMKVVNSEVEPGEEKVVNSRYSIVLATAKRARQIIDGANTLVNAKCPKPLSIAVDELYHSEVKILTDEEAAEEERLMEEARLAREAAAEKTLEEEENGEEVLEIFEDEETQAEDSLEQEETEEQIETEQEEVADVEEN